MSLELWRGVNIEGWLNFLKRPDAELRFARADVELLAGLGFDHLRINVNEQHLWDESGRPLDETFGLVGTLLDWCEEFGLKAIFDLHVLRCHHFNAPERPLFTDPPCVGRFLDCWRQLSGRLRSRPNHLLAYEFLNEPVADDPEDWNRVSDAVFRVLRDLEPERTLVLGSNLWSEPESFQYLTVPDDRNLILTFHFYRPMLLTHHRAQWTELGAYSGPVHYPGRPLSDADIETLTDEERRVLEPRNTRCDRAALGARLATPLEVAEHSGLPLYCGEWGCIRNAPRDDRLRWHTDMISILARHGIGWAVYSYWSRFGAVQTGEGIDEELVGILTS